MARPKAERSVLYDVLPKRELISLVEHGFTDEEIAEMYYVHVEVLARYRQRLGINRRYINYPVKHYFRMKETGLTDEQVAYVWGISRTNLNKWKSRMGITAETTEASYLYNGGKRNEQTERVEQN